MQQHSNAKMAHQSVTPGLGLKLHIWSVTPYPQAMVVTSMVALHMGQAYPTYSLQGYSSVPAVPGAYGALKLAAPSAAAPSTNYLADTQEVTLAKQQFMRSFR